MLLTRRRLAGGLALALAGALSAGVASGVERVRGKSRKRPALPPPFSHRDKVRAQEAAEGTVIPRAMRPVAAGPLAHEEPVAPEVRGASFARREQDGRPARARVKQHPAWRVGVGAEDVGPTAVTAAEDPAEAHTRDAAMSGLTARIPAPMRVGWTVVEASSGRVRLLAEVERRMGFGAPVEVRLSLPRGAELLEGPADFTVPEGTGGDVRTVAYVVTFATGALPAEDLVLVAHAEGASFGAHAEPRYAFGRMPAAAQRPVPDGPVLSPELMRGVHRRLRPEEYGGRVDNQLNSRRTYPLHPSITTALRTGGLAPYFPERYGSYLLPQAYPEGAPTRPAYGAGHATLSGACATSLKAFFDESALIESPVVPSADGLSLVAYTGTGASQLTVGGELLTKFDGTKIRISQGIVTPVGA